MKTQTAKLGFTERIVAATNQTEIGASGATSGRMSRPAIDENTASDDPAGDTNVTDKA